MRRIIIMALWLTLGSEAIAQETTEIGDRVRVTFRNGTKSVTGTITLQTAEGLVLETQGTQDSVVLPLHTVKRIHLSRGHHPTWSQMLKYGAIGGAVGALSGALVGPLVMNSECLTLRITLDNMGTCVYSWFDGDQRAKAAVVGGIGGAIIGAVVALVVKSERWEELDLQRFPVRIALPSLNGATVGLSLSF